MAGEEEEEVGGREREGGVELCHLSPALAEPRAGGGPV